MTDRIPDGDRSRHGRRAGRDVRSRGRSGRLQPSAYETHHPRPGWAEQDPDEWWSALTGGPGRAQRRRRQARGDRRHLDRRHGVDGGRGRRRRPAAASGHHVDGRARVRAGRARDGGDPALKYNGHGDVSAEFGLPKALWIRDEEPEVFEAAATSPSAATGPPIASPANGRVDQHGDRQVLLRPRRGRLARPSSTSRRWTMSSRSSQRRSSTWGGRRRPARGGRRGARPRARHAGRRGRVDAYAGALGLGVVEPGAVALITGSSHVFIAQAAEPVHGPGFWGAYTDAMIPGQYTVEAGQASTGSVVAWFKRQFAGEASRRPRSAASTSTTSSASGRPRCRSGRTG